jgi:hypothetical protein
MESGGKRAIPTSAGRASQPVEQSCRQPTADIEFPQMGESSVFPERRIHTRVGRIDIRVSVRHAL